MRKTLFIALAPMITALGACGEPIDGSDTADLEADAVTTPGSEDTMMGENPAEDGMLQTEVEPTPTATEDAEMVTDPTMEETDPGM